MAEIPASFLESDELTLRKSFIGLDEQDSFLLQTSLPRQDALLESLATTLEKHLSRFEEAHCFIDDSEVSQLLQREQLAYFRTLFQGPHDEVFFQKRYLVGQRHHEIGLKPAWYIGAFCHYMTGILQKIHQDHQQDALQRILAFVKMSLFDISLTTEAYFRAEHEQLTLLSKVFQDNIEGVFITDTAGIIQHANKMSGRLVGIPPNLLLGIPFTELIANTDLPPLFISDDNAHDDQEQWQGEIELNRAGGVPFPAKVTIMFMDALHDTNRQRVIEFTDITESKRNQAELAAKTEELSRSNRDLEQFAYIASHDLQEPLRMVASYTQLLARRYQGKLDADADEFISYAVDGAERMQQLINDLLTFSRIGTRGSIHKPVDIEFILSRALFNLKNAIDETQAHITHDPLPHIPGDTTQLIQLFQNLIGNAIKFRNQDPVQIHIANRDKGKYWLFSVRDNGIGIPPEFAQQIFAIFQRLHSRQKYPGTGIGLALCKKIVERHNGQIWVEPSPEGSGSLFQFTLSKENAS
ncbi:MAG: ATP-binding protein [Betaproteobacteria bacterium]|nr:ATP-binding protein [Betaproteobacteria bacterium]